MLVAASFSACAGMTYIGSTGNGYSANSSSRFSRHRLRPFLRELVAAMANEQFEMDKLNLATRYIGAELFDAGLNRVNEYVATYSIPESEIPLVLANAYLRVAIMTNASAFGLEEESLAARFNGAIWDAIQERRSAPACEPN